MLRQQFADMLLDNKARRTARAVSPPYASCTQSGDMFNVDKQRREDLRHYRGYGRGYITRNDNSITALRSIGAVRD